MNVERSAEHPRPIDVSVIIVNYNVKYFVEQCLKSVYAASDGLNVELFVVDNGSTDGSLEYLMPRFPDVIFINNKGNLGFGRANNIALEQAAGKYLFILNPDTLIAEDSLKSLIAYMVEHPAVGVVGPKILTRYGGFDKTSKRGLPTPWVAFCRLSGLSRLFPRSKLFGRYDLMYLDPDKSAEVDSLAGSCMMVRRDVYEQTGGFDEDFFMYGEDIDWSYRIKLAGWKVHYAPVTQIVHFRGESTRRNSQFNRDRAFYGAMHLFADKHFRGRYHILAHWAIDLGIVAAWLMARFKKLWRRVGWATIDWIGLWGALAVGRWIRWGDVGLSWTIGLVLSVYATVWVICLAGFGVYGKRRGDVRPLLWGLALGFLLNNSFVYFFKQFAYSRMVNLIGGGIGGMFVWGWREALRKLKRTASWQRFYQRRTLVVGVGEVARNVIRRMTRSYNGQTDSTTQNHKNKLPYLLVGLIDPDENVVGSLIEGCPVLGCETDLGRLVHQEEIEEIIFAYERIDYDRIFRTVNRIGSQRQTIRQGGINFKVVTPSDDPIDDGITPLLSVEYLSPRGFGKSLRKIASLIVKP
ncbi:MAG: glycosyltransferase [Candidatus Electryoneaceae bacterium]|nr:glycosyltransferase [Candidatus Electryoneaceae bacterium]